MHLSHENRETAAALEAISDVAREGIAAIARGDFTLVRGPEGSHALMTRLNERAAERAATKAAAKRANG